MSQKWVGYNRFDSKCGTTFQISASKFVQRSDSKNVKERNIKRAVTTVMAGDYTAGRRCT